MKTLALGQNTARGFALPTVIIASVIMLIVLMTAVTSIGSVTTSLASQYYNQLAREAAEAGLAHAQGCLRANGNIASWTDAAPLRPDKNCSGGTASGASAYVASSGNVRSSYSVGLPASGASGSLRIAATGMVDLVRTSSPNEVWRSFSYTAAKNSRYSDLPQIASGAGWKDPSTDAVNYRGHNGYMLAGNGVLYGWGDNSHYQLGPASLGVTVTRPVEIQLPSGVPKAQKVFNSGQGASVLCILGTHSSLGAQVYCRGWGLGLANADQWTLFTLPASATASDAVVNGYSLDGICVKANVISGPSPQAYCAGINDNGVRGDNSTSGVFVPITSPTKFRLDIASPGPISGSAASLSVQKVFTQDRHTCVIASDNQAYCSGDNLRGQLGRNSVAVNNGNGNSLPGRVLLPTNRYAGDIVLTHHGATESVFIRTYLNTPSSSDRAIYATGSDYFGTTNKGVYSDTCNGLACPQSPYLVAGGAFSKMISIGERGDDRHSICMIADNSGFGASRIWCTGSNAYGELGYATCAASPDSPGVPSSSNSIANVYGMNDDLGGESVDYTKMGPESTYQMNSRMVITTVGNVWASGDNQYGKLGTSASFGSRCNPTPARVSLPAGVTAMAVANNDEFTSFILGSNGAVYAMGRNHNGQLGDGTTTDRNAPVQVQIPRQETIY